jgi:hypothetical protein
VEQRIAFTNPGFTERLRADIAAYHRIPPTAPEAAIAVLADTSGLADETDWEAL